MENKIKEIISDFKNKSNKELIIALDFLSKDFDETKDIVIKLTKKLDKAESLYNQILKEYESRSNV
jgi:hypothetical protein